jgi:hypothetical protein
MVNSTTINSNQVDYWNVTAPDSYAVTLNDSMTVSSGNQLLEVDGEWNLSSPTPMWSVVFLNDTTYNIFLYDNNGSIVGAGYSLVCTDGSVQVNVTSTQVTFTSDSAINSFTINSFQNLLQITTINDGGGTFVSGELDMSLTTP